MQVNSACILFVFPFFNQGELTMPEKDKNNIVKFDDHNDVPFSDEDDRVARQPSKMFSKPSRSLGDNQYNFNQGYLRISRPRKSPYDVKLFDVEEVHHKIQEIGESFKRMAEKKLLEKMAASEGIGRLRKQPKNYNAILNRLEAEYPHFQNVVAKLRRKMKVNSLQKYPSISFGRAILLTGPAGSGKSSFLFKLSEALNTEFYSYSCAATSNAFDLVGLSGKWGNGSRGKIFELLVEKECPNPIVLLDEIEKVADNGQRLSSLSDALYGLLEKNNARYFHDEFIDQKMDASKINWFATANDTSLLPAPILDRFDVVEVRLPSSCELMKMVPNLYKKILVELNVQNHFDSRLDESVIKLLSLNKGASIRRIKAAIEDGVANAVDRYKTGGKLSIKVEDVRGFNISSGSNKPIGFIWQNGDELSLIH